MKSIDAQSCRALKSRGSRTSRRIVIRTSTNGLPNQEAVPRILFCAQRNTPIFICDSPAQEAGRGVQRAVRLPLPVLTGRPGVGLSVAQPNSMPEEETHRRTAFHSR